MDTGVNVQVMTAQPREQVEEVVHRALAWFDSVERICTRFDRESEVMRLLFEVAAFALDLAEQTDGAFDPTIGATMERLGFNTNYRTGETISASSDVDPKGVSFKDVHLDRRAQTILLRRPLILDLN